MYNNRIAEVDELKKKIDEFRPLSEHQVHQLKEYYRIGLAYSSNALEGNTLTEVETKIVIEDGITIGGKPLKDHYEAIGHSDAYDYLFKLVNNDGFSEDDVLKLHELFYLRIDKENAGRYRTVPVIITGSSHKPPPPSKIEEYMSKFLSESLKLKEEKHPIEFASIVHSRLVTMHPFIDGNGRAARLLMNLILMQKGYVITIIPPILRNDYLETVSRSNKGEEQPFINFISSMVYESAKDYLRLIKELDKK